MKQSEAAKLVMMLMAAYPHGKATEATSAVYEKMLLDLDYEAASQAVTLLIATNRFLPAVAEIRATATDLRLGPPRTGGEAWADAIAAVRTVGRYGVPQWQDPLLGEAMRLWGSWRDFCNSPEDDPGGRARFIEMYEQLTARQRADVVSGIPLPAPRSAPQLVASGPRPVSPTTQLATVVGREIPQRPPSAFAGKRLSAEEIEAAMDVAS